jgi:hypothetical protein
MYNNLLICLRGLEKFIGVEICNLHVNIFARLLYITFDVDYQGKSASMNLVLYMAIKHHPTALKTGIMISIVGVNRSRTNFVKVFQNQLLL